MSLHSALISFALAFGLAGSALAADPPPVRELHIEPSTTSVPLGHARLSVETLTRTNKNAFDAGYRVDVSPMGFMSEEGRLTINVSDAAARQIADGQAADFTGTAASTAGNHSVVQGTATPSHDTKDAGTLRVRIESSKGILIFKTTYHLVR